MSLPGKVPTKSTCISSLFFLLPLFLAGSSQAQVGVDQIVKMKNAGLSAEATKAVIEAGLSSSSVEEVIKLKQGNIEDSIILEYIKKLKGKTPYSKAAVEVAPPVKVQKAYKAKRKKGELQVTYQTDFTEPTFQDLVARFEELILGFKLPEGYRESLYGNFIVVEQDGNYVFTADTLAAVMTTPSEIGSFKAMSSGRWKNRIHWQNGLSAKSCDVEIRGKEIFFTNESDMPSSDNR